MPLTASDVANKQFTTVKLREGYNMEEVDGFLDEVEGELGRLHREIDDLTARLNAAPAAAPVEAVAAVAPAAVVAAAAPTDSAVRMLELAQKTADEHVAGAKAEADRILADARATHARTMGDLEGERNAMQAKVDELRNFEKEYRTRLRSYLEGQLRDLEAKAAVPAAAAAAAPTATAAPPAAPAQGQVRAPGEHGPAVVGAARRSGPAPAAPPLQPRPGTRRPERTSRPGRLAPRQRGQGHLVPASVGISSPSPVDSAAPKTPDVTKGASRERRPTSVVWFRPVGGTGRAPAVPPWTPGPRRRGCR